MAKKEPKNATHVATTRIDNLNGVILEEGDQVFIPTDFDIDALLKVGSLKPLVAEADPEVVNVPAGSNSAGGSGSGD